MSGCKDGEDAGYFYRYLSTSSSNPKLHLQLLGVVTVGAVVFMIWILNHTTNFHLLVLVPFSDYLQTQPAPPVAYTDVNDQTSTHGCKGANVHTVFHGPDFLFPNPNGTFELEKISADKSKKLVLHWLESVHLTHYQSIGSRIFAPCPESRCALTTDPRRFNESAAVLFFAASMSCSKGSRSMPVRVSPDQMFVYAIGESPVNGQPCGFLNRPLFFNWTMTYRLDSDIRAHYTYKVPLETKRRNFAEGKSKLIAWIVSHCKTQSRREDYIKELSKFVPVDVYGNCGNLFCPRDSNGSACFEKLKAYKFYLAFENSMCKDYVTEKMVNALEHETVPIVYGDSRYKIFPRNSYISAYDYPSPKKLANYLLELDNDDAGYNRLMEWRYQPKLVQSHGLFAAKASGFCLLCKKLHQQLSSQARKLYPSISQWWNYGMSGKIYDEKVIEPLCRKPDWFLS